MKKAKIVSRVSLYLLGLFIITIGINLSIISGLGISPVSAFTYPISQATGVSLGVITFLVYSILVIIQIVLLKKRFKWKNLLQIPFSICFGAFVNITGQMLAFIVPTNYISRLIIMILGIVVCAFGAAIYIVMDIVPNAPEGFNLAVTEHFKIPFSRSKVLSDCLFVSIGFIISLISVGKITAIREGTIISALLTGKMIGVYLKVLKPTLEKIAFEKQ